MFWDDIQNTTRDLGRLYQIASVLIRYGFGDIVRRVGLGDFLTTAGKVINWTHAEELIHLTTPQRVRRAMEDLGPAFIKLGQILSIRIDIFPPEYIAEFEKLQSHTPPVCFEDILPQMIEDLGGHPDEIFMEFDKTPIGSASIAQTYKAKLKDDKEVAVKVRKPGIKPIIESDLELLRRLAETVEKKLPDMKIYHPKELAAQFAATMRKELDFVTECRNADRAAAALSKNSIITIPHVYWEFTKERINVQEYLKGIPGHNLELLMKSGMDTVMLARKGAIEIAGMIIEHGFFHADPHPGNIIWLVDEKVGLIDWGMVGRLSDKLRNQVADLMLGMINHDTETVMDILMLWSGDIPVNKDALSDDLDSLNDKYYGLALKHLDISSMFTDLTIMMRRHKLALPPNLAMMIKVFITLDGMGRKLDPDFDLAKEFKSILQKVMYKRFAPKTLLKRFGKALSEVFSLSMGLPKDLRQVLRVMRTGSLHHNIDIPELKDFGRRIDNATNRLSISLITASFILGTSVIMAAGKGPSIFGIQVFQIFAIGAMICGIWMLFSMWRKK